METCFSPTSRKTEISSDGLCFLVRCELPITEVKTGSPFFQYVVKIIVCIVHEGRLEEYDPVLLYISMVTQYNKGRC